MFLLFPSVRMGLEQTKAVTAAYVTHLKDLPLWAIEAGCKSSVAKGLAFPPSAPELRASAEQALQPIRDEEAAIRKVLDAEVYHSAPKAERERVKAGFQKLVNDLKSNDVTHLRNGTDRRHDHPLGRAHRPQDRRDAKEPVRGDSPLPTLSDHALEAFNSKAPKQDAAE